EAAAVRAGLHVHAVGIGPKVVGGVVTETIAIRVYVVQKLRPEDGLPEGDAIPPDIDGIPTDVIESPPAFLFQREDSALEMLELGHSTAMVNCSSLKKKEQNPVIGGISTGREGGSSGTIACFCRSTQPGEENQILVLSNSHVFGPSGGGNEHLLQPASQDVNPPFRRFAKFLRATSINLSGAAANDIDAAVGSLLDGIGHSQEICSIGPIAGTALAGHGMQVRKHGRNTGLRTGVVDDIHCDVACGLKPVGIPVTALFRGQFRITKASSEPYFAYNGDSGSLVVDQARNAVGLLFASPQDGSYGMANYIGDVLRALNITLL